MRVVLVVFGEKTIGNGHTSKDKKFYLNKSIFTVEVIKCWNSVWTCILGHVQNPNKVLSSLCKVLLL